MCHNCVIDIEQLSIGTSVMMKRLLIAAVLASTFAGPTVTAAEAGPLRDKIKSALSLAKQDARGLVRTGAMMTKCALKGKRGALIC